MLIFVARLLMFQILKGIIGLPAQRRHRCHDPRVSNPKRHYRTCSGLWRGLVRLVSNPKRHYRTFTNKLLRRIIRKFQILKGIIGLLECGRRKDHLSFQILKGIIGHYGGHCDCDDCYVFQILKGIIGPPRSRYSTYDAKVSNPKRHYRTM